MHHLKQRNKLYNDEMYQLIAPHLGNMEFLKDGLVPDKFMKEDVKKEE